MNIADNIKRIRINKGLSQKQVISAINMGAAQYSRIENGKTDPSISTIEKIAKALGVSLAELFEGEQEFQDVDSYNTTTMEKVSLIEKLSDEEKKTIFAIVDAFVGKQKLKKMMTNALESVA